MKSIIPTISGLLLLIGPAVVQGQYAYITNADGSSYAYSTNADGSLAIEGYSGPPWSVTIPAHINGATVTIIGAGAFADMANLTAVTIPGSVNSIGYSAFYFCPNLTNATLLNGITNLEGGSFAECYNLSALTIPNTLTSIGDLAFHQCQNLPSVTIPNGVTSIGYGAFWDCTSLTNVLIPASVVSIGVQAFCYCTNMSAIIVDPGNPIFFSQDGVLFNENQSNLVQYPSGLNGEYNIPGSVSNIEAFAFTGSGVSNVTIPGSVTSIAEGAFSGCHMLNNTTIPASVTTLGDGIFAYCANLSGVFFHGNAPTNFVSGPVLFPPKLFYNDTNTTAYYLPGTTGWGSTYQEIPAVLWNPLIQTGDGNFGVQNNQFGFDIKGTAAIPIVVEGCTNLANPVWTALTNVTLTNGLFHFSEPAQPASAGRFYRIGSP